MRKRVGSGSVSVVYSAIDQVLGTHHAVKIILPDVVGRNSKVSERFLLDARESFALRHRNIVAVTDSGLVNESIPFLVMEFVPGTSLQEALSSSGPIPPSEAFEYISTIGDALAVAHARGIVHRDLKPRNILIEQDKLLADAIRISDFGLSAIKSGRIDGSKGGKSSGILRSPLYLAPEEWSEEESDARSDIYSLGVMLYEMLAGRAPFKGKSIPAVMKSHLVDPPPQIPGISSDIEKVVLHALEKDPVNRPASVEKFVEEFRLALATESAPIDLEQTIVISKIGGRRERSRIATSIDSTHSIADVGMARRKPEFEMTLIPGVSSEVLAESEEEPDVVEQPSPASIQPILLALGVVLVIVLIGIGVYYSRMSQ